MSEEKKIAVVAEDDKGVAPLLVMVLKNMVGFTEVHVVDKGEEVLPKIEEIRNETDKLPDLLLTDHGLAGKMTGFEVVDALKEKNIALPTVMVTGSVVPGDPTDKVMQGARERNIPLATKPVSPGLLKTIVSSAMNPAPVLAATHVEKIEKSSGNQTSPGGIGG